MQDLTAASALTSEAADGGLRGLYGPHGGQQASLQEWIAQGEEDPVTTQGQQGWVREEGRESGTGWN